MTSNPMGIIQLTPNDATRYIPLRSAMLQDSPWAFASSPEDDRALNVDNVKAFLSEPENELFVVEDGVGGPLVAAAGVLRTPKKKMAHRAMIWGVYVAVSHRRHGFGRTVIQAAIEAARTWPGVDYVDLGVSENSPAAEKLYRSLGFVAWGRQAEVTDIEGRRYDEIFMSLPL